MSFYQTFFRLLGRIRRGEFWTAFAMWAMLALPAFAALVLFEMGRWPPAFLEEPPRPDPFYKPPEAFVFWLILFYPLLAISVKRLHDLGRSGWWSLPMIVAPVLMLFAELPVWHREEDWSRADRWGDLSWSPPALWIGFGVVALLLLVWWVIALGTRAGTPGPNRFGPPNDKAIGSAAAGE